MKNKLFDGKADKVTAEFLQNEELCKIIELGQTVLYSPVRDETPLSKDDYVLCKINDNYYICKIMAVQGKTYQISNNSGRVKNTITRKSIFGKYIVNL